MTGPVLLVAIALAEAATASVAPRDPQWRGLVVVLVPPIDDDVTRNALARVSGELAAAPFRTITKPIDPDRDVMAQIETAGSNQSATAAFALVRDRDPGSSRVTIWVSNRVSGTTTMQRMQVEGGNVDRAAARLAIETVELVRASLAELWPSPTVETPPPTVEKPAPPPPSRNARLALAVGVGLITNFGDVPSTWAPQIAVSYGRPAGIAVRLFASGLGPGATLQAADMGGGRLERALLTLGLVRTFRSDRTVQPLIGIAAGVHHLSAQGTSSPTGQQHLHDLDDYRAVATASVGVGFALSPRVAIIAEADVLMIWPPVEIRVGYADVATFDRPSLFTHAGLLASF